MSRKEGTRKEKETNLVKGQFGCNVCAFQRDNAILAIKGKKPMNYTS